jgi:hypothetical protein
MRFVVAEGGPLPPERWPNDKDGLILLATQVQDGFFRNQKKELRPMLTLVQAVKGVPHHKMLVPERSCEGFQEAFMDIIITNAKLNGFLGALVTTEGYTTFLKPTDPGEVFDLEAAKKKGVRRESLIVAIYNAKGPFQMRTTPFHRDQEPGLPIADGPTNVLDVGDGGDTRLEGRLVPDL